MSGLIISCAALGYALCLRFPEQIDAKFIHWLALARSWLHRRENPSQDFLHLLMVTRILSALRAGISLDGALEEAQLDSSFPIPLQEKIKKILANRPERDFISQFIHSALESGVSCMGALFSLQKIFRVKIRIRQKINAAAGQAKAQAEVLSWLPWMLAFFIFLIDPGWFRGAVQSPVSWFLWSISLALAGLGKIWFQKIIHNALAPSSQTEGMMEGPLPDLLMRVISGIAMGKDPQSALETSLAAVSDPFLTLHFTSQIKAPDSIVHFKSILRQSNKGASGIRDELMALLEDIHSSQESKWEERSQKIPVLLMAPLFLCFFPSTILVILGLLLPTLGQIL